MLNKSSTAEQPITDQAYQQERPVFDCSAAQPVEAPGFGHRLINMSNADFVSLAELELLRPRQPDGALPALTFLRSPP